MKLTQFSTNDLVIRRLTEEEVIENFNCGDDDLNDYVLNNVRAYRYAKLAVTYVISLQSDVDKVLGFCSLANDRVSLADFENNNEFNRFRKKRGFPQSKRLKSYPAIKICRLGVDLSAHGCKIGSIFLDFIKQYFAVDNKSGCRFVTVDAYLDAIPFYEKNGFLPLSTIDEDPSYTKLMYYDLTELYA